MPARAIDLLFAKLVVAVAPLDSVRASVLRALGRGAARWYRSPSLRVGVLGVLGSLVATVSVLVAPYAVALFAPLLFGVPHVLADVRYLIARPKLRASPLVFGVVAAGTALSAVFGSRASTVALAVLALTGRDRVVLRASVLAVGATLATLAFGAPKLADLVFAHAHHMISLVAFAWLWRTALGPFAAIVAAVALPLVAIATGLLDGVLWTAFDHAEVPMDGFALLRSVAFGTKGIVARRITAVFLIAQSFHYAIWLRLIPESSRGRRAPRSFGASLRALADDVGAGGVLVTVGFGLAFLIFAAFGIEAARNDYLAMATFHGHLELLALAALALWPPSRESDREDRLAA